MRTAHLIMSSMPSQLILCWLTDIQIKQPFSEIPYHGQLNQLKKKLKYDESTKSLIC